VDVVKERPTPENCINCKGVFGSKTLFELEFDMKAKKSKVICSICKGPLQVAQKEARVKRVTPQGLRMDVKRDSVLSEMSAKWSEKDGLQKGDGLPLVVSYRSIYQKSYSEAPALNVQRARPSASALPPRPPFARPTTFKLDYQWRGKGAKPDHPRVVCKELNHVK